MRLTPLGEEGCETRPRPPLTGTSRGTTSSACSAAVRSVPQGIAARA